MENLNLPKFLFVGVAKAGTTSIFNYLKQHPQISIPVKETFFYISEIYKNQKLGYPKQRDLSAAISSKKNYIKIYNNIPSDIITGEIGTGYLYYYKNSIPKIQKYLGKNVKICMILRNPIDRAFSSYLQFTKDMHEKLSFSESIKMEDYRKKSNWDFMWYHVDLGKYYEQVKAFKDSFYNVKVTFYEDLANNPEKFMSELFQFLEVKDNNEISYSKKYNESGAPKFKLLQKAITHESGVKKIIRPIYRTFFNLENREYIRKYLRNKNLTSNKPGMTGAERNKLHKIYSEDILKLSELLDIDLQRWLN